MWPATQHIVVVPAETFRKVTASFSSFPGKDEIQRQNSFEKLSAVDLWRLFCIVLCCVVLYCVLFYCIVLCFIVFYCVILYYIIL